MDLEFNRCDGQNQKYFQRKKGDQIFSQIRLGDGIFENRDKF